MPSHKRLNKRKSKRRGVSKKKCKTCTRNRQKSKKSSGLRGGRLTTFDISAIDSATEQFNTIKFKESDILADTTGGQLIQGKIILNNVVLYLNELKTITKTVWFPDACNTLNVYIKGIVESDPSRRTQSMHVRAAKLLDMAVYLRKVFFEGDNAQKKNVIFFILQMMSNPIFIPNKYEEYRDYVTNLQAQLTNELSWQNVFSRKYNDVIETFDDQN